MRQSVPIACGETVALKKGHPCGANRWEVLRVGADIKLKCQGCGRTVMLTRAEFEQRYRTHLDTD